MEHANTGRRFIISWKRQVHFQGRDSSQPYELFSYNIIKLDVANVSILALNLKHLLGLQCSLG